MQNDLYIFVLFLKFKLIKIIHVIDIKFFDMENEFNLWTMIDSVECRYIITF